METILNELSDPSLVTMIIAHSITYVGLILMGAGIVRREKEIRRLRKQIKAFEQEGQDPL